MTEHLHAPRTNALPTAVVGLLLGLLLTGTAVHHVQVRPSCPDHYVRLLDLDGALPYLGGALAVAHLVLALCCLRPGRHREAKAVSVALSALTLVGLLWAGHLLGVDARGVAQGCWTF